MHSLLTVRQGAEGPGGGASNPRLPSYKAGRMIKVLGPSTATHRTKLFLDYKCCLFQKNPETGFMNNNPMVLNQYEQRKK